MFGNGFAVLKRIIAVLCVAQAFVLSAQSSAVILDQTHHALQIEHTPNPLAGPVLHHVGSAADHRLDHLMNTGDHDTNPVSGHPIDHHHAGDGVSAPWHGVPSYEVTYMQLSSLQIPAPSNILTGDFRAQHERPPKISLAVM